MRGVRGSAAHRQAFPLGEDGCTGNTPEHQGRRQTGRGGKATGGWPGGRTAGQHARGGARPTACWAGASERVDKDGPRGLATGVPAKRGTLLVDDRSVCTGVGAGAGERDGTPACGQGPSSPFVYNSGQRKGAVGRTPSDAAVRSRHALRVDGVGYARRNLGRKLLACASDDKHRSGATLR